MSLPTIRDIWIWMLDTFMLLILGMCCVDM